MFFKKTHVEKELSCTHTVHRLKVKRRETPVGK